MKKHYTKRQMARMWLRETHQINPHVTRFWVALAGIVALLIWFETDSFGVVSPPHLVTVGLVVVMMVLLATFVYSFGRSIGGPVWAGWLSVAIIVASWFFAGTGVGTALFRSWLP